MRLLLLAAVGGAVGSGARYLLTVSAARFMGPSFPWGTLTVNIVGGLLMGIVIALVASKLDGSAEVRTLLATGVLGGFTTFSAFSLEVVNFLERGDVATALVYVAASVVLSVAAVALGLWLVRNFVS